MTIANNGPMAATRVVDLTRILAGPLCAMMLGDMGAEIIKVEPPGEGDPMRRWGVTRNGDSLWWPAIGRNKRSVTLDLKHPRGREALLRLVETADALVESFRPGVLERLDLAPDTLHEVNARLVVVRESSELPRALEVAKAEGAGGLLVQGGPPVIALLDQIVSLAALHRLPAMYGIGTATAAGGGPEESANMVSLLLIRAAHAFKK